MIFGTDQFNIVSIGFNQPADSFQSLKSFARQYRIDVPNWEFLSPHATTVEPLTREFGFSYLANPAGFDHTLQVTLLDSEGRIYQQIYGEELTAGSLESQSVSCSPTLQRNAKLESMNCSNACGSFAPSTIQKPASTK